jgi:transcriptional regulator of arginine metabolism
MQSTTHLLREILLEGKARTQAEIGEALEKLNIKTSQSKISRLLHSVGAVKVVDSQGKTHYRLPHETGLIHELTVPLEKAQLKQWILGVIANETLIIIHTTPGAAAMVARILDQQRMQLSILGTIAGDDTIFIAPRNNRATEETIQLISALFHL